MSVNNVLEQVDKDGDTVYRVLEDPVDLVEECDHPADRIRFVTFGDDDNAYMCVDCGAHTDEHLEWEVVHDRLREKMEESEGDFVPPEWVDE